MQQIWKTLENLQLEMSAVHLRELFKADPNRFKDLQVSASGLFLDFSKNRVNDAVMQALSSLAEQSNLSQKIKDIFSGVKINTTEDRAVLHTALRNFSASPVYADGGDVMPEILLEREKMRTMVERVHSGAWLGFSGKTITDVVNIGIGGSDLGPRMVVEALQPYQTGQVKVHFVSNVDGSAITSVLKGLYPERTLFIIASKTFTTQETLMNAMTARSWSVSHYENEKAVANHFLAISTNMEKTAEFGIDAAHCFTMWDWVGGRYSLWSAIGLPIAMSIGMDNYEALLKGAYSMDQHFQTADFGRNMPIIMALLSIWNSNFWGCESQAILSYDERLSLFVSYLQQADMESNGKSCTLDGRRVDYDTGITLWGGVGTNGQHAFHQLLHQGTITIPVDFIMVIKPHHNLEEHHQALVANCLSQSQALMSGKTEQEAYNELLKTGMNVDEAKVIAKHKAIEGNKPSNTLVVDQLSPERLGAMIALYEHKIFVQGVIWNINSFDQWGVELGKQLGKPIFEDIQSQNVNLEKYDCSTAGLLAQFLAK